MNNPTRMRRSVWLAVFGTFIGMFAMSPAAHAVGTGGPVITSVVNSPLASGSTPGPITVDFSDAPVGSYTFDSWCASVIYTGVADYAGDGTDDVQSLPAFSAPITGPANCGFEVYPVGSPDNRVLIRFTVSAPTLVVDSVSVSPTSFYGYPGTTTIRYRLNRAASVKTWVTNSAGTTVRWTSPVAKTGGYNTWAWNGRNNSGTLVAAGAYRIRVEATKDGLTQTGSGVVTLKAQPLLLDAVSVSPDSFYYPNATRIQYRLNRSAGVSAWVTNSAGTTVRRVSLGTRPAGYSTWAWNGLTNYGTKAPAGAYRLHIKAVVDGTTRTGSGVVMLHTQPLVLGAASVSPANFFPLVRDGYRDTTTMRYHLNRAAIVTAWVTNSAGTTVRRVALGTKPAGYSTWTWTGYMNSGTKAPAGAYRIHIKATKDGLTRTVSEAVTVATGWRSKIVNKYRTGYDTSSASRTSSCYVDYYYYTQSVILDCWGGDYAQANYAFYIPSNATAVHGVVYTNGAAGSVNVWHTWTNSTTRVTHARVTDWDDAEITSVRVSYTIKYRV